MKLQFRIYKLTFDKIYILPKDNTCHHIKGLIPLFNYLHLYLLYYQIIYRFLLQILSSLSFQTNVDFDVIHTYDQIVILIKRNANVPNDSFLYTLMYHILFINEQKTMHERKGIREEWVIIANQQYITRSFYFSLLWSQKEQDYK